MRRRCKIIILYFLCLLCAATSFAQRSRLGYKEKVYQSWKADATYIEDNRKDSVYDLISRYFNSGFYNPGYGKNDTCDINRKIDLQGLPMKWSEMSYYNGKFYPVIVSPDDVMLFQVNDSEVVTYDMDGALRRRIISFARVGKRQYEVTYGDCRAKDASRSRSVGQITIYIADDKTKQAIFDFHDYPAELHYWVMVSQEHIRDYPAIVKNSSCCRTGPFFGDDDRDVIQKMIAEAKVKK